MARYIAVQPIYFGAALAFAAGSQVPEGHVERFGYLDAGMVAEVDDDHRGDAPHLVPAQPDNAPPSLTPIRYLDEAALRVEQAQREFVTAQAAGGQPVVLGENGDEVAAPTDALHPQAAAGVKPPAVKAKPATGDTTTPVKEG